VIEVDEPVVAKEPPVIDLPPAVSEAKPVSLPVEPVPETSEIRRNGTASAKPLEAPRVEAVVPLIHVPDDPGPEPEHDPEPETPAGARGSRP
jgi:HemY protein